MNHIKIIFCQQTSYEKLYLLIGFVAEFTYSVKKYMKLVTKEQTKSWGPV